MNNKGKESTVKTSAVNKDEITLNDVQDKTITIQNENMLLDSDVAWLYDVDTTKANDSSVRISQLHKRFGEVQALEDVSFEVNKGELFGLIGPDGPAKPNCSAFLPPCFWPMQAAPLSMDWTL